MSEHNTKQPDSELVIKDPIRREPLIAWRWSDGRMTMSKTENEAMDEAVEKAERRYNPEDYESGTVVGTVYLNESDEIESIHWKTVKKSDMNKTGGDDK